MHELTSKFLEKYCDTPDPKKCTVGDFVEQLGSRSFALVILILSLPQAGPWPMPPGMSALMGLPMMFIALQLVWGNKSIWLPKRLNERPFTPTRLKKIIRKILPFLRWLEHLLHPRLVFLFSNTGMRLIGLVIAILALIVSLPIPGANFLPALSISFLSIAVLQRDGFLAILSIGFSLLILIVMYQLLGTGVESGMDWLNL